jgi:hypothetical protein
MRFFLGPSLVVVAALMLLVVTPAQSAPPCPLQASLLPDGIPDDVCPQSPDLPKAFADMAWQTFKMLIWPASTAPGSRGKADIARGITDMSGPRVFEAYKSDWETFPARAAAPRDWNFYPSEAAVCKNASTMRPPLDHDSLVLASLDKFGNVAQPDIPGSPDTAHRLMAQNGSLVRYLAAFDENAFNKIQKNKLYKLPNDDAADAPPTPLVTLEDYGTITIKSAWIEIKDSDPDLRTFYFRSAWVQDPSTQNCSKATVALVGLHIVHKTFSSPQWIWASFEHVNNVPRPHAPPSTRFTFNDRSGTPMPSASPRNVQAPYNVERLKPIAQFIQKVNAAWQGKLHDSVWSNYQVVVVQWPGITDRSPDASANTVQPSPPCNMNTYNVNMANTAMETFLQSKPIACSPYYGNWTATCMGCHNYARNYDFIWAIPLNANSSPDAAVPRTRRSALSALREITGENAR